MAWRKQFKMFKAGSVQRNNKNNTKTKQLYFSSDKYKRRAILTDPTYGSQGQMSGTFQDNKALRVDMVVAEDVIATDDILRIRCLWLNFEHGHFSPHGISLQQAESLAKCTHLRWWWLGWLRRLHDVVNSTSYRRRMSSSIPVVVLRVENKRSRISRRQGF